VFKGLTFSYFLFSILLSNTLNPISIAAIPLCLFTLNPIRSLGSEVDFM